MRSGRTPHIGLIYVYGRWVAQTSPRVVSSAIETFARLCSQLEFSLPTIGTTTTIVGSLVASTRATCARSMTRAAATYGLIRRPAVAPAPLLRPGMAFAVGRSRKRGLSTLDPRWPREDNHIAFSCNAIPAASPKGRPRHQGTPQRWGRVQRQTSCIGPGVRVTYSSTVRVPISYDLALGLYDFRFPIVRSPSIPFLGGKKNWILVESGTQYLFS